MKKLLTLLLCLGFLFGCTSNKVEDEKQKEVPSTETKEEKKEETTTCEDIECELEGVSFTLNSSPVPLIQSLESKGWYVDYSSYIISGNDYDLEFANENYDQFIKVCFDLDVTREEVEQIVDSKNWNQLKGCKIYQIEVDLKDFNHRDRLVDFRVAKSGIHSTSEEIIKDLSNYQIELKEREVEETPWNPAMSIVEGRYYYGESTTESLNFTYWCNVDSKACQGIRYSHFIY